MQFTAVITACSMDDHNEEKRREQNLFVRAVNLKRNLRSTFCTIEADRHEASRGLSATAELLVWFVCSSITKWINVLQFFVSGRRLK